MCGIAGSYRLGSGQVAGGDRINAALKCLAHRGPDDEGIHKQGHAVLGHRRLSIIDTSAAGHQPFTDDGGRCTIVFNGEVFNFPELRARLEAEGHTFRSRTDTEVVLRLFAVKGESFLHELNGFFALAIHDAEKDELLIARDRFGVKPLWYSEHEGQLLFASELRALKALGAKGEIDRHSLQQYFTYHYMPAPYTVLKGVRKLEPGELLRVSQNGVKRERWYDLAEAAKQIPAASDPVERIRELLDDAVRLRLVGDVPVGAFLSGGLDSSIMSALAARHHKRLRTFSIGFADEPYFDETRYAEAVAQHIGSDHTSIRLTQDDLASAYTELLATIDEPFADSSALPYFILCRAARKQITVALGGDGADEIFGGYRKHQAELRLDRPGPLEKAVIALKPLWRMLPRSRNSPATDAFRKLERFASANDGIRENRWLSLAAMDEDDDAGTLVAGSAHPIELSERENQMTRGMSRMPGLNGYLLADVQTVLPNDMLHKVDLCSMAHSLEVRTPFLDRRVVEFAFSLPPDLKLNRNEGKIILRKAFGELLPKEVLTRPKQGFEVPLLPLFLGPLAGLLDNLLTEPSVREAGLEWNAVQNVRRRLHSGSPGGAQATLHALAVFMAWWKTRNP